MVCRFFFNIRISEDLVLVIAEDNLVACTSDNVLRQKRYLPAAARGINNKGWDGKSGSVATQLIHNLQSFAYRRAEVIGAFGDVGLIEVIWTHAHGKQLAHQLKHHIGVVVHAFHQHSLVTDRAPRISEHFAGALGFKRAFPRMIEMCIHINGMIFPNHLAELRSNPLWQNTGHLCSEAYNFDMRYLAQSLKNALKQKIGQHQWIAARENDIPYLRILRDVIDAVLNIFHVNLCRVADLALARAEPAVH